MTKIGQPYTSGDWMVKPGNEEAFIAQWEAFIDWSLKTAPGSGPFFLIRDTTNPQHFISFGAWDNAEDVSAWRRHPEFQEQLGKCRALCESLQARDSALVSAPSR